MKEQPLEEVELAPHMAQSIWAHSPRECPFESLTNLLQISNCSSISSCMLMGSLAKGIECLNQMPISWRLRTCWLWQISKAFHDESLDYRIPIFTNRSRWLQSLDLDNVLCSKRKVPNKATCDKVGLWPIKGWNGLSPTASWIRVINYPNQVSLLHHNHRCECKAFYFPICQ